MYGVDDAVRLVHEQMGHLEDDADAAGWRYGEYLIELECVECSRVVQWDSIPPHLDDIFCQTCGRAEHIEVRLVPHAPPHTSAGA